VTDRARGFIPLAMLAALAIQIAGCSQSAPPPTQASAEASPNMQFGYHPPTNGQTPGPAGSPPSNP